MYGGDDVRGVHLEMAMTAAGAASAQLALDDVRKIFPERFVRQLKWLYMRGNYGDPIEARDTLPALEYFRSINPGMSLQLITHGDGRDGAWWRRLAKTVTKCVFNIDGLQDTHNFRRPDASWGGVLASAASFIGAGGRAEWAFSVFRHNEHQVEEARALSGSLGFAQFNVNKAAPFFRDGEFRERDTVRGPDGRIERELELPVDPAYRERVRGEVSLMAVRVSCRVNREREIYVSAEGHAFPCCWTARLYSRVPFGSRKLLDRMPGGAESLDARRHPLGWIIEGPFFQNLIARSWEPESAERRDNPVCALICGTGAGA